jgi:serine/threonine protein kinase
VGDDDRTRDLSPEAGSDKTVDLNKDGSPDPAAAETVGIDAAGPPAANRQAKRIGVYRLLRPLGEGGMGLVYLAEQTEPIRRMVALKVIRARVNSADVIARFEAERQALAIMNHPGIAKVLDAGVDETGSPYFVMEYVAGAPITTYCDKKRLTNEERIKLFIDTCMAIQHAHQKGIIHRDLKPSNILVTEIDGVPAPKVIDFGIAKATTEPLTDSAYETHVGTLIGTPAYMSPEQASLDTDIDTRADVYALGVVLYELLVGALPFEPSADGTTSLDELRRRIIEDDPERPSGRVTTLDGPRAGTAAEARRVDLKHLRRQLRGEIDWIILRALEKDRERRYQTANALALELQRHLRNEPVRAAAPTVAYRTAKFVRRNRAGVAAAALILATLIFGLAAATVGFVQASRERDRARAAEKEATREAKKATATSTFLTTMLLSADPSRTQGKDVTIGQVLDQAAATVEESFADQPETEATVRTTIGSVYDALGAYGQAAEHSLRAVEIREEVLGHYHRDTAVSVNQLAVVRFHERRFDEAESLWRRNIDILEAAGGPDDPDYLLSVHNLGAVLLSRNELEKAEELLSMAYQGRARVLGDDHAQTLASMSNLAQCFDLQGRHEEAEPILRRVLEVRRRELGDRHPRTIVAVFNLADSLAKQGQSHEALTLAHEAHEGFTVVLGDDHPNTRVAAELVARLEEPPATRR